MRRLILFRHAKSSWVDATLSDHARPLNARGQRAAPLMGAWMRDHGHVPDLVLLSDSARTRETWALAAAAFDPPPPAQQDASLYHASPAAMLRRIATAPVEARTLCLIGHMPGIGSFARKLSGPKPPASCARAFQHFPTAAVAVLEFEAEAWSDVTYGAGRFTQFACPRELA